MKYSERIYYKLSKAFKNSIALDFLEIQLEKEPYDYFKYILFKEESYEDFIQGTKIRYEYDDTTKDITVLLNLVDNDNIKRYLNKHLKRHIIYVFFYL